MSDIVLVIMVVFVEMFLHYFPWRLILRGRELPRLAAYTLGVLGLMGPFTAWLIERGNGEIAMILWIVIVAGGAAVTLLYLLDWVITLAWGKRESEEREHALLGQRNGESESA
jgi:hypothetical protein